MKKPNPVAELSRMHRHKSQADPVGIALGPEMIDFFKQSVAKRQTKLVKLAECWGALVPPILSEHCALECFVRGTLTVMVDSSSHLYELKQLLLAGLEEQLLFACKSAGLRKITLRPGRWYEGDRPDDRRIRFSR
jgi:hypothetical protein